MSKLTLTFQVHIIDANTAAGFRYGKTCIQVMDCNPISLADRLVQCYRDPKGYGEADRYLPFIGNGHDHIFEPTFDCINLCLDWQHYDDVNFDVSHYCQHKIEGHETYAQMKKHMKLLDRLVKKGAQLDDPASVVEILVSMGAVHVKRVEYTRYQSELVAAKSAPVFRTSVQEVA